MNKFIELSKLNKDIELLEAHGNFKAANVLHIKFLKISQVVSEEVKSKEDLMTEFYQLAQNPDNEFEKLVKWYESDPGRYSEEDRHYIDEAVEKASKQRNELGKFTTVLKPKNPTLKSEDDKKNTDEVKTDSKTNIKNDNTSTEGPKLPILDEREQGYVYRRIVKQIKSLLMKKLKVKADKLALDYKDFFENPERNVQFVKQVNKIYKDLGITSPIQ